jgi:two-component system, sensor histidine kinase and response regulator
MSVIDTGIGISEEGIKKLFIDFAKLDENSKRNTQGTGLGLSICKNIIEEMGGSVEVKSKVGEGTEFRLNIKTHC